MERTTDLLITRRLLTISLWSYKMDGLILYTNNSPYVLFFFSLYDSVFSLNVPLASLTYSKCHVTSRTNMSPQLAPCDVMVCMTPCASSASDSRNLSDYYSNIFNSTTGQSMGSTLSIYKSIREKIRLRTVNDR